MTALGVALAHRAHGGGGRVVEQQVDQRRLARAGLADQRCIGTDLGPGAGIDDGHAFSQG